MSRFATCVSVTTALGGEGPVGCTTTAVLSLSLRPPTLLVSLRSTGHTLDELLSAGVFAVNVLSRRQADLVDRFATGDPRHRFDGVPSALCDGAPVLPGAAATVVCRVREAMTVLDHTLLVGTALSTRICPAPPLVLLDGRPHTAAAAPPTTTTEGRNP
ncbi:MULTISPECIES: flavin reductase family protein [Amycolatopsis]|nr:flavin reductase family protein [Amycolatopsis bullii]